MVDYKKITDKLNNLLYVLLRSWLFVRIRLSIPKNSSQIGLFVDSRIDERCMSVMQHYIKFSERKNHLVFTIWKLNHLTEIWLRLFWWVFSASVKLPPMNKFYALFWATRWILLKRKKRFCWKVKKIFQIV